MIALSTRSALHVSTPIGSQPDGSEGKGHRSASTKMSTFIDYNTILLQIEGVTCHVCIPRGRCPAARCPSCKNPRMYRRCLDQCTKVCMERVRLATDYSSVVGEGHKNTQRSIEARGSSSRNREPASQCLCLQRSCFAVCEDDVKLNT